MTYPLNQSQMGIYLACMGTSGAVNHIIDFLYELTPEVNLGQLAAAADKTIAAHPYVLSRLVVAADGEVAFEEHSTEEYHTPIMDVAGPDEVKRRIGKGYDLMHDRLFRQEIYKTPHGNYFYVSFHHVIFDGLSREVYLKDIERAYAGEPLAPETVDGFQIAEQEAEARKSPAFDEAKAWYAQTFSGAGDIDSLPLPDIFGTQEGRLELSKEKVNTDKVALKALCERHGVKESMVFNVAFAITLSKFIGQDEVPYVMGYHGRNDKRTHRSLTMMMRLLPLMFDLQKSTTVAELLQVASEQTRRTRQYDVYSFGDASRDLGFRSDVGFVYQGDVVESSLVLNGQRQPMTYQNLLTPGFKFLAMLYREDGGYVLSLQYETNQYSKAFIDTFRTTFETVLGEVCRKEAVADIVCSNGQTLAVLDSFNTLNKPSAACLQASAALLEQETVVSRFRQMAREYPQHTAVVFRDRHYTYGELDGQTDRLAAVIAGKLPADTNEPVVSILIHRNEWMVLASLAALKAGCAYQPLDASYPQDRLNLMVNDANARLLIADDDLRAIIDQYDGPTLLTSELKERLVGGESQSDAPAQASVPAGRADLAGANLQSPAPSSLFTLLYTSGSTGKPKGVMLEHRNLLAYNEFFRHYVELGPDSRVAAYASFGFDANMMDIYCTLTNGATLHIIDEDIRLDIEAVHEYFEREGITNCFMTTQVGVQFLETYPQSGTLRHLVIAGEKLPAVRPEQLSYKIYNGYGPSETTCGCALYPVVHWEPNIPIGTPTDLVDLFVVDRYGHRLPPGAPGELWICGQQVGRGYLNQPEKTAAAFIDYHGRRAYRSGDIVRYRQNGDLEFVGRKDGQVKIRGFRIELKEVEAVIRDFQGVKDVTVQAFDDPNGGKFIAAYVVTDGPTLDIMALNDFIASLKPPYMVPAVTMQIDKIPLTVNQKVDKKALPKPQMGMETAAPGKAQPMNDLELTLYKMVAAILNLPELEENDGQSAPIGVADRLAYHGLTSISSMKLASAIYKRFGLQIDIKALAKNGSLQTIENELLAQWMAGANAASPEANEVVAEAPLSFSQLGVYLDCLSAPQTVIYNLPMVAKLPSAVTPERAEQALAAVVAAHPCLWTHFVTNDRGKVIQTQMKNRRLQVERLHKSESEDLEEKINSFPRPFQLHEGPLFRFALLEDGGQWYLLADIHHLIADGASCDIFFRDFCEALEGRTPDSELYDYYQFAAHQQIDSKDKEYFASRCAGIEGVSMLMPDITEADKARPGIGHVEAKLDLAALSQLAGRMPDVTTAGVCLAIANICVGRYTASDEVTLCTISNGRSDSRLQNTVGMFVNTLPFVSHMNADDKVSDYLLRTSADYADTLRHEYYPFARIAEDYGFKANIMFAYQVGVIDDFQAFGEPVTPRLLAQEKAKLPVYIYVEGTLQDAYVRVEYDRSLYSETMMQGLADAFACVAGQMTEKTYVRELSLADRQTLAVLDSFNANYHEHYADEDKTVVTLFRRAATAWPDNKAVVFNDKTYTYRELDELTDRMAAAIAARIPAGVSEPVASIIIPRGEYMVLASLAALKAGCAYQPLDPTYPQDRLNFMVNDARASLLIAAPEYAGMLSEYQGPVMLTSELVDVDTHAGGDLQSHAGGNLPSQTPESLFILLYTSGSTGVPKGVMLEHRNLVAFCDWFREYYSLKPGDCVGAYASYGFDACMMDMYPALTTGATVCIVPEELRLDLVALNNYYGSHGVTHAFMTTQVGVQFLQAIRQTSLHHLSVGGEKLVSVEPAQGYKFHNGYGPTECTIFTTAHMVDRHESNIPLGRPTTHLKCYVLDKYGHRLPVGAAGELLICGQQVGRGYLNRPEMTAEVFVNYEGQNAYRSGDIVRYRQNGNIEFVGRRDGQVKIRGFRIELKEVEAVIRNFQGVKDVTVQAFDDSGSGGKFMVAYVVTDGPVLDTDALNDFITSRKPPYMVPAVTMQIDKIPLTVNQKVDKKALPVPELKRATAYEAPKDKMEEFFCKVFSEVLNLKEVGAIDNFFEIGGTSINAIKVIVEASKQDVHIVFKDLFDLKTPRALAEYVSSRAAENTRRDAGETSDNGGDMQSPANDDDAHYAPLNAVLSGNTIAAVREGECQPVGDVLLTGATGYLGIHILNELLTNYEGKIFCPVRAKSDEEAMKRLKKLYFYYFEHSEAFGHFNERISAFAAEVTKPNAYDGLNQALTVINCVANVKHFSAGNDIEMVNIESVRHLVSFCLRTGSRLVHISTESVAGLSIDGKPGPEVLLTEHDLWIGQDICSNKYVYSKFKAEELVLDAVIRHGLNAKIMRVGNLAARQKDGEFQINFNTNNFLAMLRAYVVIGMVPYDALDQRFEFSPIDETARAVMQLAVTPKECIVFHPSNTHLQFLSDILTGFAEAGITLKRVEQEEFRKTLDKMMENPDLVTLLRPLMAYDMGADHSTRMIDADNSYTTQVLYRLGFQWPPTAADYVRRFVDTIVGFDYWNPHK